MIKVTLEDFMSISEEEAKTRKLFDDFVDDLACKNYVSGEELAVFMVIKKVFLVEWAIAITIDRVVKIADAFMVFETDDNDKHIRKMIDKLIRAGVLRRRKSDQRKGLIEVNY